MASDPQPAVDSVFEPKTCTWQYVVADPETKDAVIIDSVLDYDPATNKIGNTAAEGLLSLVAERGYNVVAILETHAHADHLTASRYIQQALVRRGKQKAPICIGKLITQVQRTFAPKYGVEEKECDGVFDRLLDDGDEITMGRITIRVLHLPGHTPDHVGYLIGSNAFVGDSIFHPDVGSARCDFPGGSAQTLFHSITKKLYALAPDCRIYVGHDYPPGGEGGRSETQAFSTVEEQRRTNKHVRDGVEQEQFVAWRAERDATLGEPRLLHQSLQMNIRGGRLPAANDSSHRLLHLPLKVPAEVLNAGFAS